MLQEGAYRKNYQKFIVLGLLGLFVFVVCQGCENAETKRMKKMQKLAEEFEKKEAKPTLIEKARQTVSEYSTEVNEWKTDRTSEKKQYRADRIAEAENRYDSIYRARLKQILEKQQQMESQTTTEQ